MPNRIIKESARSSKTLDRLSDGAERLFWRLTTVADDFGRFEADPEILLATCFPRRVGRLTVEQLSAWYGELEAAELVRTYVADDRSLGYFVKWGKHQTTRAKDSKYPTPPPVNSILPTSASRREQMSPGSGSGSGSGSSSRSGSRGGIDARARDPQPPEAPPAAQKPDPPVSRKRSPEPRPQIATLEPPNIEPETADRIDSLRRQIGARDARLLRAVDVEVSGYLGRGGPLPPLLRALEHAAEYQPDNPAAYIAKILRVEEPNHHAEVATGSAREFQAVAGSSTLQGLIDAANRAAQVGGASVHTEGE